MNPTLFSSLWVRHVINIYKRVILLGNFTPRIEAVLKPLFLPITWQAEGSFPCHGPGLALRILSGTCKGRARARDMVSSARSLPIGVQIGFLNRPKCSGRWQKSPGRWLGGQVYSRANIYSSAMNSKSDGGDGVLPTSLTSCTSGPLSTLSLATNAL